MVVIAETVLQLYRRKGRDFVNNHSQLWCVHYILFIIKMQQSLTVYGMSLIYFSTMWLVVDESEDVIGQ